MNYVGIRITITTQRYNLAGLDLMSYLRDGDIHKNYRKTRTFGNRKFY